MCGKGRAWVSFATLPPRARASPAIRATNAFCVAPSFYETGYRKGVVVNENAASDTLVSGAQYQLEGESIQYFDVAEEFQG